MAATSVSVTVLHSLLATVPFHRLLALNTACIFRAADFIGNYTSAICHQIWEVHRLSVHADRLSCSIRHKLTACKVPCNSKKLYQQTRFWM